MKKSVCLLAFSLPLIFGGVAGAHIELKSPLPRYADKFTLKSSPCGKGGATDVRTDRVTTFKPGQSVTVSWNEYVNHPGHYRIAFSMDGVTWPELPTGPNDLVKRPSELVDPVADVNGVYDYTQQVTLPNVECDKCALRLVQVMTDKQGNGWGNDEFYYACADLVLKADPQATDMATGGRDLGAAPDLAAPADLATTTPPPPMSGGCSVAGGGDGAAGLLVASLLLLLRRRRAVV